VLERLPLGPKRPVMPISCIPITSMAANEADVLAAGRLRRAGYRDGRQGHRDRHAISPGEEPAFSGWR